MSAILFAAIWRLSLGVSLLIAFLPLFALGRRLYSDVPGPFVTFETVAVLLIWGVSWAKRIVRSSGGYGRDRLVFLASATFFVASCVSSVASQNSMLSFRIFLVGGVAPLVVFGLVRDSFGESRDRRWLAYAIVLISIQAGFFALGKVGQLVSTPLGVWDPGVARSIYSDSPVLTIFGPPSATMSIVVASIPLAVILLLASGKWNVLLGTLGLAGGLFASAVSVSRGSWVGTIISIIGSVQLLKRDFRMKFPLIILLLALGIYGTGLDDSIYQLFQARVGSGDGFSSTIRNENYRIAVASVVPFWSHGLGLGSYSEIYSFFPSAPAAGLPHLWFAHSLFLTLIPEIGLIGTLGFASIFVIVLVRGWHVLMRNDVNANIVFACMVGVISYTVVASLAGCHLIAFLSNPAEDTYLIAPALIVMFALLGLIDGLARRSRSSRGKINSEKKPALPRR